MQNGMAPGHVLSSSNIPLPGIRGYLVLCSDPTPGLLLGASRKLYSITNAHVVIIRGYQRLATSQLHRLNDAPLTNP